VHGTDICIDSGDGYNGQVKQLNRRLEPGRWNIRRRSGPGSEGSRKTRVSEMQLGGLVLFLLVVSVLPARGEDSTVDFSDFWTRPTMLGGPGSPREALANAGIDINAWLTQT
jgi:hypothetical protein